MGTIDTIDLFKEACEKGNVFIIRKLIEANLLELDYTDIQFEESKEALSPLKYAIKYGTAEIVELLLTEGANVNDNSRSQYRETPLIIAVKCALPKKVKILLEYGADILVRDSRKRSAFDYALIKVYIINDISRSYYMEQMDIILDHGCQLIGKSKSAIRHRRYYEVFRAVFKQDPERLRKCLESMHYEDLLRVDGADSPLDFAIEHTLLEVIRVYMDFIPHDVLYSSINASFGNDIKILQYLFVDQGKDINMRDKKGRTGLHLSEDMMEVFHFFLEHGADPQICSEDGQLPEYFIGADAPDDYYNHDYVIKHFRKLYLIDQEYTKNQISILFRKAEFTKNKKIWKGDDTLSESYAAELETLKSIKISQSTSFNPGITLFDYLFLKPSEAVRFSRNENLLKLYKKHDENFCRGFLHYGFIINYQFRRGLHKKKLMEAAGDIFFSALGSKNLLDITNEIFDHFSNNALIKFTT